MNTGMLQLFVVPEINGDKQEEEEEEEKEEEEEGGGGGGGGGEGEQGECNVLF
jgi:hypothetical protein